MEWIVPTPERPRKAGRGRTATPKGIYFTGAGERPGFATPIHDPGGTLPAQGYFGSARETMMQGEDIVRLATASNQAEAYVWKQALEEEGIPVQGGGRHAGGGHRRRAAASGRRSGSIGPTWSGPAPSWRPTSAAAPPRRTRGGRSRIATRQPPGRAAGLIPLVSTQVRVRRFSPRQGRRHDPTASPCGGRGAAKLPVSPGRGDRIVSQAGPFRPCRGWGGLRHAAAARLRRGPG